MSSQSKRMSRQFSLSTVGGGDIKTLIQNATRVGDLEAVQQLIYDWRTARLSDADTDGFADEEIRDVLGESITSRLVSGVSDLLDKETPVPAWMSAICIDYARDPTIALETFLVHGWDINADDETEGTALVQAINTEDARTVLWLLEHGADPNAPAMAELEEWRICRDFQHISLLRKPLEFAAALCSIDIVRSLIAYGARLNQCNALHAAAGSPAMGRIPILQHLLDQGGHINALEFDYDPQFASLWGGVRAFGTPLHYAYERSNQETIGFLIEKGADQSLRDPLLQRTPTEWAQLGSHYREWIAVESLRGDCVDESPGPGSEP
ncbi:MAG: hypothetical protein Q9227_000120 [Pyrenula ochraceoflavens]